MKDFSVDASSTINVVQSGVSSRRGVYRTMGKRAFDIALAIAALPIILPVIFVLWALVRRDGSPGFYSQDRVGMNGRTFRCWKLRTMIANADEKLREMCEADPELAKEWHENQKLTKDPRITRFGHILRKSSLDELPQIWNILIGDMSFVGPRPFMVDQAALYNAAGGRAYYTVRPGITGPWQVFGRGATSFIDRVKFDRQYCSKLSLTRDLYLIWKTVGVVMRRTGS